MHYVHYVVRFSGGGVERKNWGYTVPICIKHILKKCRVFIVYENENKKVS